MTDRPFAEWTPEERATYSDLVEECRESFGARSARELMAQLGFPMPPIEDGASGPSVVVFPRAWRGQNAAPR